MIGVLILLYFIMCHLGVKNVINACRRCKVKRLIYNSTADVVVDNSHDICSGNETLLYSSKVCNHLQYLFLLNFLNVYILSRHLSGMYIFLLLHSLRICIVNLKLKRRHMFCLLMILMGFLHVQFAPAMFLDLETRFFCHLLLKFQNLVGLRLD